MVEHSFSIPEPAIRKLYVWYVLAAAAGGTISHFHNAESSLAGLIVPSVLVGSILAATYCATKSSVWVSLSAEEIRGKGYTGREFAIPWSESMVVEDAYSFGFHGVAVRRAADSGSFRRKISSIFIPQSILELEPFKVALIAFAPASNPLLIRVKNAI